MKQFFKSLFMSIYAPIILTCLCLILVVGAAASLLPIANQAVDKSDCLHPYARLVNEDDTTYVFRCPTCMATIHETPETSSFVLHKPTIIDGVVTMIAPWEIGAYYGEDYRLMNIKATDDGWYTDGVLWTSSTGVRVADTFVSMTSTKLGDAAITYVAKEAGYINPGFASLICASTNKRCSFEIRLNDEKIGSSLHFSSTSTERVDLTDEWNSALADLWIPVTAGDKLSFVIVYDGTESTELRMSPIVEVMQYNPNRK